jgi:histidyl-tRNA synthetase
MSDNKLSTDAYKGVRDFYPEDMAVLRYIMNTWSATAESFGFERYDASVLEPAELYKSKGSVNEEIVDEQTYTFIDRGEREVTLRPEMTPTVARMVSGRRRELTFPLRWYSIPNLFRYERPQRGRLREHWQFNCDIFGAPGYTADVEIISLAYQLLIDFGATPDMFEILVNNRAEMTALFADIGITDPATITNITRLTDRKKKISAEEYRAELLKIVGDNSKVEQVIGIVEVEAGTNPVIVGLGELGITNVRLDRTIARGFDYYTGTIFEILDTDPQNNRAMLGGGRYDNLTSMFGGDPISGIGFGMGDVTMRDFLETHRLLPENIRTTAPTLSIIPAEPDNDLASQKIASLFRTHGIRTVVDIGHKKLGRKIADAATAGTKYALIIGETEIESGTFVLKNLDLNTTESGSIENLLTFLIAKT